MVSLSPNAENQPGRVLRKLEFSFNGSKRYRLHLGHISGRDAEDVRRRIVEVIEDVRLSRSHSGSLCDWLNSLSPNFQKVLIKAGLLKRSKLGETRLGNFIKDHEAGSGVKDSTKLTYKNVYRNLLEHFGPDRTLASIGRPDAIGFKEFLQGPKAAYGKRPLAHATVGRRVIMARQFFTVALNKELIAINPFVGVKGGHQRNPERLEFIEAERVDELVAAADTQDWKLILLLARYGGIRIPSELVHLRWQNVDFRQERILIHSVKTAHHPGKDKRYIPLFDELRQPLLDARARGVSPYDFVIEKEKYRQPRANLRSQFDRIAERSGVQDWAKAFQNQRASAGRRN